MEFLNRILFSGFKTKKWSFKIAADTDTLTDIVREFGQFDQVDLI
jgi:hypothetical protein